MVDIYSTVAGDLPKLVEKKEPVCFVPWLQFLEYQKEMEGKVAALQEQLTTYRELAKMVIIIGKDKG